MQGGHWQGSLAVAVIARSLSLEVINALVAECGPATDFFSLGLPGSSVPTLDSILATSTATTSTDAKVQSPKMEALGFCLGPCCRCGHSPRPCPCCSSQPVTSPS
ncbi:uncharacterized protein LOC126984888 [Eriocheir sinensis]|uniref:uncharacterized protein LOC126984888 n=1 Tax=Eriocheir sinensis TaxID=95602 RepID=UPI0021C7A554|nr:uncharacterized protein LOC126984888 [Eriocheir sinensis]